MSRRYLLAHFAREEDILHATEAARARGLRVVDAYTPYPVHGLDRAMGLKPSRLPWVCFLCGLFGAGLALWFQFWAMNVSWPINVGGKPWNSLPAYAPVAFEVMVLFAGLGVVAAFLIVSGLRPGKPGRVPVPAVTDDAFVLVLEETNAAFDAEQVRRLFERFHAAAVEEREEEIGP